MSRWYPGKMLGNVLGPAGAEVVSPEVEQLKFDIQQHWLVLTSEKLPRFKLASTWLVEAVESRKIAGARNAADEVERALADVKRSLGDVEILFGRARRLGVTTIELP